MEILNTLRTAEFNIGGFLIPWAMVVWSIAYVFALLVSNMIERSVSYRNVWHPPLFFVALVVIFGCTLGLFFAP